MDTVLLEEMTWPEIRDALQNGMRTVVVCAASIEQHGPHLAERTDTTLGYAEAEALARRLGNALVAPVIRPGLSAHHMVLPGTVTLRPEVFRGVVEDYISSYVRHGFTTIVLISSHGGNFDALEEVARLSLEYMGREVDVATLEVQWRDPATPSASSKAANMLQAHAQGVIGPETAREALSLTPEQKAREAASGDLMVQMRSQMGG